ncbi:DedA family protein [Demequina pelophila]|uniref:DedA family protein n=1 Tax=Demequina pelophila TaxID=1638984 RepID=UPI0007831A57|nr:DedA family protein [Demequina pelophila]
MTEALNDLWHIVFGGIDAFEAWILSLTESWWIYPGVWAVAAIDGFFPVVPSESVVIATATAWAQTGTPWVWLICLLAAFGAWCGDMLIYLAGARLDVRRHPFFARERVARSLVWAESQLERRGTAFIIAARFIPMGRLAVSAMAGALRYPTRRFMIIDAVATAIWAGYWTVLGVGAGSLFDHVVVSIGVGALGGVLLGLVTDKVLHRLGFGEPALDAAGDLPVAGDDAREPAGVASGGRGGDGSAVLEGAARPSR